MIRCPDMSNFIKKFFFGSRQGEYQPSQVLKRTEEVQKEDFKMLVEDVFSIAGRGIVVTGKIQSGLIRTGDAVTLVRKNGQTAYCKIAGIEKFRKVLKEAFAGDSVGLLLSGIDKKEIARGMIITK